MAANNPILPFGAILMFSISLNLHAKTKVADSEVKNFVAELKKEKSLVIGNPEFIEEVAGYSRWVVSFTSPVVKLDSGYCLIKKSDVYVTGDADALRLEGESLSSLISYKKHKECPSNEFQYVNVGDTQPAKVSVRQLEIIDKVLKSAKQQKCFARFTCSNGALLHMRPLSLDKLVKIEVEGEMTSYEFISDAVADGNAVQSYIIKIDRSKSTIDVGLNYYEINNSK